MTKYDKEYNYIPVDLSGINTPKDEEEYLINYCVREEHFHRYLNRLIAERGVSVSELMRRSCINKNYGYNIINGARKHPGRDKVLALCIAAGMNVHEVQHSLILSKESILYWRDERDMRIVFAIRKGINDVMKLNIMLSEHGLEPLNV